MTSPQRAQEQFAPDCSHPAYLAMQASQDKAIGDYVSEFGLITYKQRE